MPAPEKAKLYKRQCNSIGAFEQLHGGGRAGQGRSGGIPHHRHCALQDTFAGTQGGGIRRASQHALQAQHKAEHRAAYL